MVRFSFCIYFLLGILSCGKQKFPNYEPQQIVEWKEEEEGAYRTSFKALNPSLTGRIKGHAVLWKRSSQFYARVVLLKGPSNSRIQQYIHLGSRCPTLKDDLNGDHTIDFSEVLFHTGKILIPLDSVLNYQQRGSDWFPVSDDVGSYYYSQAANIKLLMEDLTADDEDLSDHVVKIVVGESLNIRNRTIILYGSTSDPLIPLACAEID
ncbi:MAG: hypothetical protein NDI69_15085 [Bacteriovoracaceae bacterium]|nr:hypothetical protein [Bacteriovoracaceae bacterium]